MKTIKMAYVWLMYILALPLIIIMVIGLSVWALALGVIAKDLQITTEIMKAAFEGFYMGYQHTMNWIRYGDYGPMMKEES